MYRTVEPRFCWEHGNMVKNKNNWGFRVQIFEDNFWFYFFFFAASRVALVSLEREREFLTLFFCRGE